MVECLWKDCNKTIDRDILVHIGYHVGFIKDNTFTNTCQWNNCSAHKASRGAMMSHILIHVNVRRFVCKCGKGFKRKYDHQVHLKHCNSTGFHSLLDLLQGKLEEDKANRQHRQV